MVSAMFVMVRFQRRIPISFTAQKSAEFKVGRNIILGKSGLMALMPTIPSPNLIRRERHVLRSLSLTCAQVRDSRIKKLELWV